MSIIETKVFIALIYYTIFGVVMLADFTLVTTNQDKSVTEFEKHFICEAKGSGSPCDRSQLEQRSTVWIDFLTYVLLGLFPAANLMFIISWKDVKCFLQDRSRKIFFIRKKSSKDSTMAVKIEQTQTSITTIGDKLFTSSAI